MHSSVNVFPLPLSFVCLLMRAEQLITGWVNERVSFCLPISPSSAATLMFNNHKSPTMFFFQYTSSRGDTFLTQKLFSRGVWSAVLLIGWTGRGSKVRKLSLNYWSKVLTLLPGCNLIPGFTAIAAESQRKPVCIMRPKCMNFHLTFLSVCLSYTILIKHQDTQ